jgi:ADP-ribose pyrophosphatase YjhB (NUDIX family)
MNDATGDDNRAYPDRPMVGVGVVVLKQRSVLLIRRGKAPRRGEWSIPGGLQEIGETVFTAGAREVLEETGVTIGDPTLIDIVDAIRPDKAGRIQYHYTLIDLVADWAAGEPQAGSDAMHAEWITFARFEAMDVWGETKRIVAQARQIKGF